MIVSVQNLPNHVVIHSGLVGPVLGTSDATGTDRIGCVTKEEYVWNASLFCGLGYKR